MSSRSWRMVLAVALGWAVVGGGAGPVQAQKEPSTLLVLTRNQPRSLDPAKGSDNPTRKVFVGTYEPLIDHKQGTADIPNLEGSLRFAYLNAGKKSLTLDTYGHVLLAD